MIKELKYKYVCAKLKTYRKKRKMNDKDTKKMLKLFRYKNEYEIEKRFK